MTLKTLQYKSNLLLLSDMCCHATSWCCVAAIHTAGGGIPFWKIGFGITSIFLLLLPARTPQWNPIELVWNILVQRLQIFSLDVANNLGQHSLVQASQVVLDGITHKEVVVYK